MTKSEIIKVTPADQVFSITWMLGARCNFDCMYCPSEFHNNTDQFYSLEDLKTYWHNIYSKTSHRDLKYKISFSGGEPTANKDFLPFVTWLKTQFTDKIDKLLLTTNGSASTSHYRKLLQAVDNISFSLHSEHVNEQKFFNTLIELQKTLPPGKFIHVNIMNEYWNVDRIPLYKTILQENNISFSVNEINYQLQTREHPVLKGNLNLGN